MVKIVWRWCPRRSIFRKRKCIVLILIVLMTVALFKSLVNNVKRFSGYWRPLPKMEIRLACPLPKLEPKNPELDKYFHYVAPVECAEEDDWVCTRDGYVQICPEFAESNGEGAATCDYQFIHRMDDFTNNLTSVRNATSKVKLETDFFYVSCVLKTDSWRSLMCGISDRALSNTTGFPPSSMGLNVLIFGLDSLSHMTYMRKLPNTYKYMTETLDAVVLNGYNIVGDGTPQALIPILTGSMETELPETRKRMGDKANFVNVYPFIWNDYHRNGYVTAFTEDYSAVGTFSMRLKGFDAQPTDHYGRPFYLEADKTINHSQYYCLGGTPRHQVYLNYIKEFFTRYANRPKFFFGFHNELSHDDCNLIGMADGDITAFLKWLNDNGHLNNTLLIMMSDHGHRFLELRETLQGKQEERLPMFSLILPPHFKTRYPEEWTNLQMNANRLTSPFDVYPTLRDVLSYPYKAFNVNNAIVTRSISLFQEISADRTCEDAGIEAHWCTCLQSEEIPVTWPIAAKVANALVEFINNMTSPQRDLCHQLKLQDIIRLEKYVPQSKFLKFRKNLDIDGLFADFSGNTNVSEFGYQVKLVTEPGDAHFEATLFHEPGRVPNEFKISERSISRVNAYGTTSSCIAQTHHHLLKYCYCKVQFS